MGLSFTDDQLRAVSGEALAIPALIVALNAQKTSVIAGKAEALEKDNGNAAFFDFFKSTIDAYHTELKNINGFARASYLFQTLDDGAAQRAGNLLYPTSPPWVNFKPKIIGANNGTPITPFTPDEIAALFPVTGRIANLKTGFTDGAIETQLTTAYVMGTDIEVDDAGIAVGHKIVIDDAGVSLIAEVTAVKPPTTTGAADLELTVLSNPSVTLGIGARVRNYHPGFSNAEREGTSTPYAPEVLTYWETQLDSEVGVWETTLTGQAAALATLDPGGAETTAKNSALTSVNNVKTSIDTWQAAPATGAGVGRYGDTVLAPLETQVTNRNADAPARATAIVGYLGSVSQDPDGEFTGSGHYHSLFKWIDIRASKAGGSLFTYYNFDLVLVFIDKKIATANNQKAEYDAKLLVKALTEDANGTAFIKLPDVTGLSIGNAVKIVDDSPTAILSTTITGISGLIVELAAPASGFLVDQRARLVKEV